MKNNNNPYTVPDNFFEQCTEQAIAGYRKRRMSFLRGIALTALLVIILSVPTLLMRDRILSGPEETYTNNLAEMYEYDIFLQVNF